MKIVVILPTYNEKDNILTALKKVDTAIKKIPHHTIKVLVVDDSSPDKTADVVKRYKKKHKHVHILTGKKQGLGKALLRGLVYAVNTLKADIIVQLDADLSHDPLVIPAFIKAIDNGADFVIGSRYIPGGSIPDNWGIHRKIQSIVGNEVVRFGLGFPRVHDWTGGFRAYKKKFYELVKDEMSSYGGYVFQIAYLHKALKNNAHIVEVPIHFTDRQYGRSKIIPSKYIRDIFDYMYKERILAMLTGSFGKFLVVGGIGFLINAVLLVFFREALGWNPSLANLAGAAAAIFSNYNFNNLWTFKEEKITTITKYLSKMAQFYATSAFGVIVIQTGTIAVGVRLIGETYYFLYFIIGTGLLLIWNYIMYSKVIWKKGKKD